MSEGMFEKAVKLRRTVKLKWEDWLKELSEYKKPEETQEEFEKSAYNIYCLSDPKRLEHLYHTLWCENLRRKENPLGRYPR